MSVKLLYQQALAMTQRLYAGDHPDMANRLNNLATLYHAQGRLAEAELLCQQALTMLQKTLGVNHPNTQTVQGDLATLRRAIASTNRPSPFDRLTQWMQRFMP